MSMEEAMKMQVTLDDEQADLIVIKQMQRLMDYTIDNICPATWTLVAFEFDV